MLALLTVLGTSYVIAEPTDVGHLTYPEAMQQFLKNGPDPLTGAPPQVAAYVGFIQGLASNDAWQQDVEALYAPDLYYTDTMSIATEREGIIQHYTGLRASLRHFDLTPLDYIEGNQGSYLVWSATHEFSLLGLNRRAQSIGVTLFQYDSDGRIVLQQDFWDSTQGFYQHIPLVGGVLRSIQAQFDAR